MKSYPYFSLLEHSTNLEDEQRTNFSELPELNKQSLAA